MAKPTPCLNVGWSIPSLVNCGDVTRILKERFTRKKKRPTWSTRPTNEPWTRLVFPTTRCTSGRITLLGSRHVWQRSTRTINLNKGNCKTNCVKCTNVPSNCPFVALVNCGPRTKLTNALWCKSPIVYWPNAFSKTTNPLQKT